MPSNTTNIQPYYKNLVFREDFRNVKACSNNQGTITGTPTIDNGLTCTGSSDEIGYGSLTQLNAGDKATIAIRNYKPVSGEPCFIAGVWNLSKNQILAYYTGADLRFYVASGLTSNEYVDCSLSSGVEHDIVCVYDGSLAGSTDRAKIYVDGVEVTTTGAGTIPNKMTSPDNVFVILDSGGPIGTEVGSVEIFDIALTEDEIQDWLDEDTYSEVDLAEADLYLPLRNSHDGVVDNLGTDGGTVTVNGSPDFRNPRGIFFDGTDDNLDVGSEFAGTGEIVAGALCTFNNSVSGRIFDNGKLLVSVQSSGTFFASSDGATAPSIANFAAQGETFTLIFHRETDGTMHVYKNGELVDSIATGTPEAGNTNLYIGDREAGNREWTGLIADAFMWKSFENFTPAQAKYLDFVLKSKLNI